MFLRRVCVLAFGWSLFAGAFLTGCNTGAQQRIERASHTDDFGAEVSDDDEISIETVQRSQMLHQRAQVELRVGPSFAFDIFDPGRQPRTDGPGLGFGLKAMMETAKNVFWGFTVDYQDQTIENLPLNVQEQINAVSELERYAFLGNFDYDIPLWEAPDALILRLGFGIGLVVFKFEDDGLAELEDLYQILFRPAVGLRYPVHDNIVVFTEASYDIVPDKSIGTKESQGIAGTRAVLSSGTIWFGVAFQW